MTTRDAGWCTTNHQVWRALALVCWCTGVYMVLALLLLAKARTASLIFILLCALMVFHNVNLSWSRLLPSLVASLLLAGGARYVTGLSVPAQAQAQVLAARH